ncbi:MAG: hypothetical protein COA96_13565 [SAR86 cluster bacterium]|uniref:DUF922 domain-containing protein n=1 Tax=SAR86 cluster bacterium TaxID=2030880 RepID=A0A2A5AU05_9GAMM|nr:MAG: hypothetical protein COA96_13565 [SAR86 cluster bacterium]
MRAIFVLLILGLSQSSLAGKSTRTEYYAIFGSTASELLNEMSSKGPEGFDGLTHHETRYSYRTKMINGRCRISQRSMDLDIIYTMPRWENQASADTKLQTRWKAWYRLLEQHEQRHGAIAESGYADILSGWQRIGSSDNCQDIKNQVEQVYNSIRARVRQQNAEYDQTTNHGQSEGITFKLLAGEDEKNSDPEFEDGNTNFGWLAFAALIGTLFYIRKSRYR